LTLGTAHAAVMPSPLDRAERKPATGQVAAICSAFLDQSSEPYIPPFQIEPHEKNSIAQKSVTRCHF
jgi:hypothetical protein